MVDLNQAHHSSHLIDSQVHPTMNTLSLALARYGQVHHFVPQTQSTMTMFNWLVVDLPLWKMMEFASWDDEIPNWMEK